MSKAQRPGLDALPFATKPVAAPIAPAPAGTEAEAETEEPSRSMEERVPLIIRIWPEDRKALRGIAVEQDTTVQDLVSDAVQDIIRRSR